jgi:hypothetical protein
MLYGGAVVAESASTIFFRKLRVDWCALMRVDAWWCGLVREFASKVQGASGL